MKPKTLFYSSLIAAAAMSTVPAWAADAEKIQISYGSNNSETTSGGGTITFDETTKWNKATNNSNSADAASTVLKNSAGEETTATTTWTSKNTWYLPATATSADDVLKGYLDDGTGVTITVSNISYLIYNVKVIASTDTANKQYTAKTINGQTYTSDGDGNGILGSTTWGNTNTTTVGNDNSFTVSGLTGDLSLSSTGNNNSARGCVAGLIITDASPDAIAATLDGTASTWTTTSLAGTEWTNSTETTPTYANLTMSADTTLTLESGVVTDAVWAHGTGALTLAGEAMKFRGVGVLRADTGTSIAVNNTLNFTNGGTLLGTITTGDSGSIVVKSGTMNAIALTGSGLNFSVESGATVNFGSIAGISQNLSGAGTVSLSSTAHSKTIDLGTAFTGTVNISGDVRLDDHKFGADTATVNVTGTTHFWSPNTGTQEIKQALTFKENTATRVGGWGSKTTTLTLSGGMTFEDGATFTVDTCTTGTAIRVDITGAVTNGNITQNVGTLNISGTETNTISTLTQSGGTLNISAGTTTITDITQTGGTFKLSGGTLNISGAASISTFNFSGSSSTLNFSGTGTKTIGAFSTPGDKGTNRTISIVAGTTVGATSFSNTWGIQTLTINGELNVSGEMLYSSGDMTNTINGSGTLTAGTFTSANVGTYVFSGGLATNITTLNVSRPTTFSNTGKNTIGSATLSAQTLTFSGTGTTEITNITQTGGTFTQTAGTLTIKGEASLTGYTGSSGTGNSSVLNIESGASLSVSGDMILRNEHNNTSAIGATMNVSGDVSVGGNLWISRDGKGIVNIKDGGSVTAGTLTFGQRWADSSGTNKTSVVNVASGGTLIAGAIVANTNVAESSTDILKSSALNLNGGTLGTTAETLSVDVKNGTTVLPIVLGAETTSTINTGKYDATTKTFTETGSVISIINAISGSGKLMKSGAGTLELSGANTFTGDVTVEKGTLEAGSASALGTGTVTVNKGGVLKVSVDGGVAGMGAVKFASGAKFAVDLNAYTGIEVDKALTIITASAISFNGGNTNTVALTSEDIDIESYFSVDDSKLGEWAKYARTWSNDNGTLTLTLTIPEPSTFGLLAGVGALALVAARRRRRAK